MGEVRLTIQVKSFSATGAAGESVEVLADTGATLTMLPEPLLRRAGVEPNDRVSVQLADGRMATRAVGGAWIIVEGHAAPARVMFGEPADAPLLGLTVLEQLGLAVDPVARRLVPAKLILY